MTRSFPLLLLLAATATARPSDPRGWSEGQVAANAPRILGGPDAASLPELDLPKELRKRMGKKTLIFYYAPRCPHCMAVGAELGDLARSLAGQVDVIGVASGSSSEADVAEFAKTYRIDFPMVIDADRAIQGAIGARSTPSVVLVEPSANAGKHRIIDLWYPYQPGYQTYVKIRASGDPWASFSGWLGNGACAGCHTQETESWALTHHSVAWRTLVNRGDDRDPKCTGCHVTGAAAVIGDGKPGWTGPDTPHLVDVGCEACHGPAGPHDGVRTDARSTCAGCHDAKHSIAFSLDKGLPLIDHFAANGLDDDAFRARRMALLDGEVPRALLHFSDEPTQGAKACQTCHAEQTTHWAGSRHGRAMQTLRDQEKDGDPTCVRCHSTPKRGGPPPAALDGFRLDEGVGCEACHGPGGAHIAAGGGTDNIERLGDDCPVCVIEAVCTSCHTPEHDKDWDLDTHLPRVGHAPKAPAAP